MSGRVERRGMRTGIGGVLVGGVLVLKTEIGGVRTARNGSVGAEDPGSCSRSVA